MQRDNRLILDSAGGTLRGTFYLADIALVAAAPPADTSVDESFANLQPADLSVAQNLPNPFNATQKRTSGCYTLTWDGHDESGHTLASGVYLYPLRVGRHTETRKLTLLR